jgi:hypothetical protein
MEDPRVRLDFRSPEDYAANVDTLCSWLFTRGYAIVQLPRRSSQVRQQSAHNHTRTLLSSRDSPPLHPLPHPHPSHRLSLSSHRPRRDSSPATRTEASTGWRATPRTTGTTAAARGRRCTSDTPLEVSDTTPSRPLAPPPPPPRGVRRTGRRRRGERRRRTTRWLGCTRRCTRGPRRRPRSCTTSRRAARRCCRRAWSGARATAGRSSRPTPTTTAARRARARGRWT